jgi:ketosteroid isomerase-like protein
MRRLTTAAVSVTLLAACQAVETAEQLATRMERESQTARAEIEPIVADFERWMAAGQVDSLATLLAEDAWLLPPNEPAINGRADWVSWISPSFAHGTWTEDIITESIVASGPIAVERGSYVLNFTPGPDSPRDAVAISDTGKYLWHWHRVDGTWQLATASWSSDLPLP